MTEEERTSGREGRDWGQNVAHCAKSDKGTRVKRKHNLLLCKIRMSVRKGNMFHKFSLPMRC